MILTEKIENTNESWKLALYEYVKAVNEASLRQSDPLQRMLPDPLHLRRLRARLTGEAAREADCGIKITRSELRARIVRHTRIGEQEAAADVMLHAIRTCEQRGIPWQEERVEKERVRFRLTQGQWQLVKVEPLESEDRIGSGRLPEISAYQSHEHREALPSLPYINIPALSAGDRASRVYPGLSVAGYSERAAGSLPGHHDDLYVRRAEYRREEAVAYAERWWNEPNPAFEKFEVNCTNYVSQCLYAGRAPMNYTGRRESGWWYKGRDKGRELWSFSWAVADSLQRYLRLGRESGLRATAVDSPDKLRPGDVICYDWDGTGRYGHNTIVTAFTADGAPLVNANTVSSRHRYWDYRDSYAWTTKTRYLFLQIAEHF